MVYCSKCGTDNEEDAQSCVNCGAALHPGSPRKIRREKRDECFGLPQGGSIFGIIIGIIIILFGARELLGWKIDFGPFIIIIVGVLIVGGAIYKMTSGKS